MSSSAEPRPGYYVELGPGAWCSLPWPGDPALPYGHPDRLALLPLSLGPQVIEWAESNLVHHLYGTPWRFTQGQRRFLMLWFALERIAEAPGFRWLYRSGVRRAAKGAGKDPFGAAWCLIELAGPVMVSSWAGGKPMGAPHGLPLVQIGANSEAQGKDLLRVANAMASRKLRAEVGLDTGETRTLRGDGGRLELLTSSEKSAEGDPASAILLNETQHMTVSNRGMDLAEVADRNAIKAPYGLARVLELSNAHSEGDDSRAERSYQAWQAQASGRAPLRDILYDSREAAPDVNLHDETSRRAGLAAAYSDSPWSPQRNIEAQILDPRTAPATSLRYFMNVVSVNERAWVEPRNFDALARPLESLADGDQGALFLDCSKSRDSTALIACRVSDGFVATLGVWQRPPGDRGKTWLAPREKVDAQVRAAFSRLSVVWFGVDPSPAKDDETERSYWMTLVDAWHRDFGAKLLVPASRESSVLFDMRASSPGGKDRNRLFAEHSQQVASEIDEEHSLIHDGDALLRSHVHNARRYETAYGLSLGKENPYSTKLVDAAVAMVGARLGRRLVLNSGKLPDKQKSKAAFGF